MDKDTKCGRYYGQWYGRSYGKRYFLCRYYGQRYYLWQILWPKILFVIDKDTICVTYYGLRYYLWQTLWTKIWFVADIILWPKILFVDKDTCDISWTKIVLVKGFYLILDLTDFLMKVFFIPNINFLIFNMDKNHKGKNYLKLSFVHMQSYFYNL